MDPMIIKEAAWLVIGLFLFPWVVGVPVAIIWVLAAWVLERLFGIDILPADVRHNSMVAGR